MLISALALLTLSPSAQPSDFPIEIVRWRADRHHSGEYDVTMAVRLTNNASGSFSDVFTTCTFWRGEDYVGQGMGQTTPVVNRGQSQIFEFEIVLHENANRASCQVTRVFDLGRRRR